MKPSEWIEIAATMNEWWPHAPLSEEVIKRWGADLEDLDGSTVAAVVEVFYREGREFPPNGGMIRLKAAEMILDPPEFPALLKELDRLARYPAKIAHPGPGDAITYEYERREQMAKSHPLIRQFINEYGWEQANVSGGSDEARLREKWKAYTTRHVAEVARAGIKAPPEMAALSRANARTELRRVGSGVEAIRALGPGGEDG